MTRNAQQQKSVSESIGFHCANKNTSQKRGEQNGEVEKKGKLLKFVGFHCQNTQDHKMDEISECQHRVWITINLLSIITVFRFQVKPEFFL